MIRADWDAWQEYTNPRVERIRENALCCGTSAWMECSSYSKAIQTERLQEAIQTGAQTLVTACPKCQIHFACAQRDTDTNLKVLDLYTYFKERLSEN
jgi:Fe-S oxidoreductase